MNTFSVSTLVGLLRGNAEQSPHHEIYTFLLNGEQEDSRLTYAALDRQARAIGALLQPYQVQGERVLLLYPPGLEYIAAFFGCLYAGAIAVPAYPPRNPRYLSRIQTIVEDAEARVLLTVERTRSRIQDWLQQDPSLNLSTVQILITDLLPDNLEHEWQQPELTGDSLAFLQYTSGSTSTPKGVMVTHRNLIYNSTAIQQAFELTPAHRLVSWLPPYHDMGLIGGILQPFFAGFPVILMTPAAFLQSPVRWLLAISNYRATISGGPNFAYDLCVEKITPEQCANLDLSSWDLAFNGAEPIHADTLERFARTFAPYGFRKEALYPCYGLAESTLLVTGGKKVEAPVTQAFQGQALENHEIREVSEHDADARTLVGVGQSVPEQTIIIADPDTGASCLPEQIGEIWLASPGVAQGYWNRHDLTQESFYAYLSDTGEGPFLRTGDLGFLKDRELFITGRRKDLIIIRGRNHYPQDIERHVEHAQPAIRRDCSAAFSIEHQGEERLVVVAELERRYMKHLRQLYAQDPPEPRIPEEILSAEIDPGFSPDLEYPPDIQACLRGIREAVAEQHEINAYAIVLIKPTSIPRTSSGKIRRHACKEEFLAGALDVLATWRSDDTQNTATMGTETSTPAPGADTHLAGAWETFLADLWAEALDIPESTLHAEAHFFRLGGDSLRATTLVGSISSALGVELDPDLLYQYPTLSQLAAYCEQEYGMPPANAAANTLLQRYQSYSQPAQSEFPLLPLQQSFYIARQLGDVPIYVVLDIELRGLLDVARFQEAIQYVVKRHPALRLAFATTPQGSVQYSRNIDDVQNHVEFTDLCVLSSQEQARSIAQARETLSSHTFDNAAGETLYVNILRCGPDTHRVLINFDHLAIDGFSLTTFFQDLHHVYSNLLQGKPVNGTPQTSLSFKDYVQIYTARQTVGRRDRDIAYWMEKFPMREPFPDLGIAPGPADAKGFSAHLHHLDPALVKHLHEHARTYGVTFFSVLMAAFFKLLALWSGSPRLTINTPHLNRRPYSHDVQRILGCFTDILPVKTDNILDESLLGLARHVHRLLAELHRHASISGVDIARLLAQRQQGTPEAVSPIIFSSALFPLTEMSSADTYTFSSMIVQTGAPATWLDVVLYDACGEFVCSWNYLRRKFSPDSIALLAAQYEQILDDFSKQPQQADPLNVLLQSADFAARHHTQQQQAQRERHLSYWREQFDDLPALQLPTNTPFSGERLHTHTDQSQCATRVTQLSESIRNGLDAQRGKQQVPLSTILVSVFQTLLCRYTHQTDIAVGMFMDDRETQQFSATPMLLRCNFSDEPDIQTTLDRVHQKFLDAEQHRHLPLSDIQAQIENAAFQVIFCYHAGTAAVPATSMPVPPGNLELRVLDTGQDMTLTWQYNRELFEATMFERMIGHFHGLLAQLISHPDGNLFHLPMLTEAEYRQILVDWNDTQVAYPFDVCLHERVEAQAERTPDAIALVFANDSLTYRDLNAKANQLAHYLRSLGVGPETLVGISVERSFEMVIGLLGIMKAGGAYVPMDPEYPKERLAFMIDDAQVSVLLTQEKFLPELPSQTTRTVCLDRDWERIAQEPVNNPVNLTTADNLIYVIYTSGSTGKPKGAMNIHRALVNRLLWMQDAYGLTAADRVLQKTPFSFDVSGWEFWWPLITGARLVIAKPGGHKDSAYLIRLIREQAITTLHFVPPMLQVFLEEPDVEKCDTLRQVICSGEALPYELQKRFFTRLKADLHNLYGPTEAAIDVTFWQCRQDNQRKIVPIGRPIANTQIYVLDQHLHPVPVGVPGELHIGGVNLARGYWNRPELTQEKFIPDPFSHDPDARLYKTGDLVRYLPDGNIEYLGRLDHQVKIRGFRIELGEIETALTNHPGIREAVVLAREIAGEKRLTAYIVPRHASELSVPDVRDFLKSRLPEYMIPAVFVSLDAFPLSPNGKIDRRALPNPEQHEAEETYVAPRTPTEQQLADMWGELLGMDRVGITSNFFDLGGHSLMAAQVASRVRETFGIELPLTTFFEVSTVSGLADIIVTAQLGQAETNDLERLLSEIENLSDEDSARQLSDQA